MIKQSGEVADALAAGEPVVALESALITHGLPRRPGASPPAEIAGDWDGDRPVNYEIARAMIRCVRASGAIPALVAVLDGQLHVGLDEAQLERLAMDAGAHKASSRDLAHVLTSGVNAGVTVAATLRACGLTEPEPIRVFATGGIGGVHRGWRDRPDVSADLRELARSPVCVVSAGAKSILDLPATAETLETLCVPVVGYRCAAFPRFVCSADQSLPLSVRRDAPGDVAALCAAHWRTLGQSSAVLVMQEIEAEFALPAADYFRAVEEAEAEAKTRGVVGPSLTPFLLERVAILTDGASLRANLAILLANARIAGEIAVALTDSR